MIQIKVKHTLQMAHRLHALPGKCQSIHGHTWLVILGITGATDHNGVVIDYHEVKDKWRSHLDGMFDHRLVLDQQDPIIYPKRGGQRITLDQRQTYWPGHILVPFQPTVENLALHIVGLAEALFGKQYWYTVEVWEGDNNCAIASSE